MPTPSEKKALIFLATVALLGGTVRVWRAHATPAPHNPQLALERQLAAVDSAKRQASKPKKGRRKKTKGSMIDGRMDARGPLPGFADNAATASRLPPPAHRLDLDLADSAAIDHLPGVSGKLAGRIVADRKFNGAFGFMEGFRTVPGVTPTLAARLDSLVTFSGPRRPLNAVLSGRSTTGDSSVRRGRRRRP